MDPITLTVVFRAIIAALFIVFAFAAMIQAVRLYREGSGKNPEKSQLQLGNFKVTTTTASAFLLAVAALALGAALWTAPKTTKTKDDWKVASFSAQGQKVEALTLATALPGGEMVTDPQSLKILFDKAALASDMKGKKYAVTINGKPAAVDPKSSSVLQSPFGGYVITSMAQSGDRTALVTFRPQLQDGQLVFYPVGGIVDATEFGTNKAPSSKLIPDLKGKQESTSPMDKAPTTLEKPTTGYDDLLKEGKNLREEGRKLPEKLDGVKQSPPVATPAPTQQEQTKISPTPAIPAR